MCETYILNPTSFIIRSSPSHAAHEESRLLSGVLKMLSQRGVSSSACFSKLDGLLHLYNPVSAPSLQVYIRVNTFNYASKGKSPCDEIPAKIHPNSDSDPLRLFTKCDFDIPTS